MTALNPPKTPAPIRRVGRNDLHSFFGYYNKSNFSQDDRFLLAQRTPLFTGDLTGKETAEVGYYDLTNHDQFHKLGDTTTWNWQMGAQLQWRGKGNEVIFNTRANNPKTQNQKQPIFPDFRSTLINIETKESRELPLPIYVMAPRGDFALTVNYSRLLFTHRTIGYAATEREPALDKAPKNDGIFRMDIDSGDCRLIVSLDDLKQFEHRPSMDKAIHWISHMEVNPSGNRFLFLHRWTERVADETCFLHRLFTMNGDGSDLRLLECSDHPLPQLAENFDPNAVGTFDYEKSEYQISHPMWKSDTEIIVWGPHNGKIHYHLYDDTTAQVSIVGPGILDENGHMTYARDGRWLLSDTYPDAQTNERILFLFDTENAQRYDLGQFYTPPDLGKHNRCDLHPRWSRDNKTVCIDSVHEGTRQLYLIDVAS